jgi:hypothetical protein
MPSSRDCFSAFESLDLSVAKTGDGWKGGANLRNHTSLSYTDTEVTLLTKCAEKNMGKLVLFVMLLGPIAIGTALSTIRYCVCSTCITVSGRRSPCRCISLANHLLQSALGRNDSQFDSKNLIIGNRASIPTSTAPCEAHPRTN